LENHRAQNNKYVNINKFNVDQCIHYFIFLQKALLEAGALHLAEKVYFYTRVNFCVDIFPTRRLPEKFLLVHPLGAILGDASYGNFLVVYQNVTVGGNPKLEYPSIRGGCVLYAGSKIIGRSTIGENVIIGAGVVINNESIPANTTVFLDWENRRCSKNNNQDNIKRYFK
jgi:serine O-acetyltransferase